VAHDAGGVAGHNDVRRDPDVCADDDRQGVLEVPLPVTRVDGVGGGAELYALDRRRSTSATEPGRKALAT
jgi:hypothetical protein